VIFKHLYFTR